MDECSDDPLPDPAPEPLDPEEVEETSEESDEPVRIPSRPARVGEDADNLRRREEWFRKRSGR